MPASDYRKDHETGRSSQTPENDHLLDSFEGGKEEYEDDAKFTSANESGSEEDNRLLGGYSAGDGTNGANTARQIDRDIHQAVENTAHHDPYRVASSSSSHSLNEGAEATSDGNALESQRAVRELTTRERIMNVFHHFVPIKQTYDRINNGITTGRMQANTPGRFIGQGTDGVFRNLMAKPDTESNRQEQEVHPPTYEEAAADASPEYWESTVISPMYEDEVFVEGLPVGNYASFMWNALVTVAFQFVGFVLCYLLHTSHAAKQGSRAGLGITLAISGFSMVPSNFGHADELPERYVPTDPNSFDIGTTQSIKSDLVDNYNSGIFTQHTPEELSNLGVNKTPYFAYGLIAFGLFISIKSIVDFFRVKQMEKLILVPPSSSTATNSTENA